MADKTSKPVRALSLRKARKAARLALKQARKLIKKHGKKISEAGVLDVQAGIDGLVTAYEAKDAAQIQEALSDLDARLDRRMSHLRKSPAREYIESIGSAVLIALVLRAFIIEAFTIPSGSMIPTLAVGDFLFVNKLAYGVRVPFTQKLVTEWAEPARGDVIVFVYPCEPALDYIKRVMGLPGDVVHADADGFLYVNGERMPEVNKGSFERLAEFSGVDTHASNCAGQGLGLFEGQLEEGSFQTLRCAINARGEAPVPDTSAPVDDWSSYPAFNSCPSHQRCRATPDCPGGEVCYEDRCERVPPPMPWKVPAGHVFVMGDNRQNSQDSRFWGFVPVGAIKGKAMFIWLSWDGARALTDVAHKIRWSRLFSWVHH